MKASLHDGRIQQYWYPICFGIIVILALFLRFYNYTDRFALAGDQARDALVAREAYKHFTFPPLGPFSSAGNFTTGFIWYTWLILSTAIFPDGFITPWVVLSVTYVGIVILMMVIGHILYGKPLSLIAGLYTAISPAQIIQSLNITNPSLVAVFSVLSLFYLVRYIDSGRYAYIFLLGISIGLAINAHFQALYLAILIPIVLILRKDKIKAYAIAFVGMFLPFIPYLLVDSRIGFYNLRGIIDYALYGQNKIYVPNRWLTYAFGFLPDLWGQVIGGSTFIGYIALALTVIAVIITVIRKKLSRSIMALIVGTFLMIIMLRYYKGERHFGYFVFIHPFILILTAWMSFEWVKFNKYLGAILIGLIFVVSMHTNYRNNVSAINITYNQSKYWTGVLTQKYSGKKFDIYTVGNPPNGKAISLVLYLDSVDKIDDNGYKIGFGETPKYESKYYSLIKENTNGYDLWDIESTSSAELKRVGWYNINPSYIYETTTQWYKTIHNSDGFKQMIDLLFSKL